MHQLYFSAYIFSEVGRNNEGTLFHGIGNFHGFTYNFFIPFFIVSNTLKINFYVLKKNIISVGCWKIYKLLILIKF